MISHKVISLYSPAPTIELHVTSICRKLSRLWSPTWTSAPSASSTQCHHYFHQGYWSLCLLFRRYGRIVPRILLRTFQYLKGLPVCFGSCELTEKEIFPKEITRLNGVLKSLVSGRCEVSTRIFSQHLFWIWDGQDLSVSYYLRWPGSVCVSQLLFEMARICVCHQVLKKNYWCHQCNSLKARNLLLRF